MWVPSPLCARPRHPSVGAPLVGALPPCRSCRHPPVGAPLVGALPPVCAPSSSIRRGTPCGRPPPCRSCRHPSRRGTPRRCPPPCPPPSPLPPISPTHARRCGRVANEDSACIIWTADHKASCEHQPFVRTANSAKWKLPQLAPGSSPTRPAFSHISCYPTAAPTAGSGPPFTD